MQANKNGGLHHISIMCDKLENLVDNLEKGGLKIIGKMYDGPDRWPSSTRRARRACFWN